MKWIAVDSSLLTSVAYEKDAEVLWLRFHNGRTYKYREVPEEVYEDLLDAESKGQYFLAEIRDAYPYARVK